MLPALGGKGGGLGGVLVSHLKPGKSDATGVDDIVVM